MSKLLLAGLFLSLCLIDSAAAQKKTIILVRHAETVDASQDPDLSAEGKERAQRLRSIVKNYKPGAIYSTDFKRTRDTVAPMGSGVSLRYKHTIRRSRLSWSTW